MDNIRTLKSVSGLILVIAVVILASCAGCTSGQDEGAAPADGKIMIATSIIPSGTFIEKVAGDHTRVMVMIPKGASPATYDPTPEQMVALSDAALYVKVGSPLPFETKHLQNFIESNPDMQVVDASEGISVKDNDPHIWNSPKNAIIMVQNIASALEVADPANATDYRANAESYTEELIALDNEITTLFSDSPESSFMIFHPAWSYFADTYAIEQIPIELEGKEPGPKQIASLITRAQEGGIHIIFTDPQFSSKSAETIAAQINGQVLPADPLAENYTENLRSFAEAVWEANSD